MPMAAKPFDSATYLRGLGWQGPGSSLNNSANGRAKPVTVVQKKTLAGIGRDRDTSFAWWDAVFTSVANKVGSTQPEQRRTTTGILSHRPPPPKANAYDESPQTQSQSSGLNLDAMAAVKLEQARRQLYSGFLRGSVISGSKDEEDEEAATGSKGKKRSREEDDDDEEEQDSPALSKAERKAARAARKDAKAQKKLDKEARRAAKKKGKSAAGGESSNGDDLSSTSASASASRATSIDTIDLNPTAGPNLREKALRRQQRKQKTTTTGAETPSSTGSATSTPLPSEVEAIDVDDELARARKAIRRAAKEERRAARAVAAAAAGAAS